MLLLPAVSRQSPQAPGNGPWSSAAPGGLVCFLAEALGFLRRPGAYGWGACTSSAPELLPHRGPAGHGGLSAAAPGHWPEEAQRARPTMHPHSYPTPHLGQSCCLWVTWEQEPALARKHEALRTTDPNGI